MKSSFRLMRIAGIDIGIHYTWIFIFLLITWTVSQGWFRPQYPEWDTATYWITGASAALMLFAAVLVHELAHSFVALSKGMKVSSITLFLFGGVSNIAEEPKEPGTEFTMSIVGPLSSLALAGLFFVSTGMVQDQRSPTAALLNYLAVINLALAIFNILPGFPLDGGRVLRSIIWAKTRDLVKATNIAGSVGHAFGWLLILFGAINAFSGNFLGGFWIAFIGWYLSSAATASRKQVALQQELSGIRVRDAMQEDQVTVSPNTTVSEIIDGVFQKRYGRAVPVCDGGRLMGIVTVTDVKGLPREKWSQTPVKEVMTRQPLYTVSQDDNLSSVARILTDHDINQVLVERNGQCAGLVSRADILHRLQLSEELGPKSSRS